MEAVYSYIYFNRKGKKTVLEFTYKLDDGMVFWSEIHLTKEEEDGIMKILNKVEERVQSKIREEMA